MRGEIQMPFKYRAHAEHKMSTPVFLSVPTFSTLIKGF